MDANGDELILYEYEQPGRHLKMIGLNRGGQPTRFALDTGEEARPIDERSFVLVATGERLVRVE